MFDAIQRRIPQNVQAFDLSPEQLAFANFMNDNLQGPNAESLSNTDCSVSAMVGMISPY